MKGQVVDTKRQPVTAGFQGQQPADEPVKSRPLLGARRALQPRLGSSAGMSVAQDGRWPESFNPPVAILSCAWSYERIGLWQRRRCE
jgi:hypothetical protein